MNRIARWDGVAWSPLAGGANGGVRVLTVFDDGTGPALYAGGGFTIAGGVSTSHIARWDGAAWSPLASGVDGWVFSLAALDDGSGPALFAGGSFATAGGSPSGRIARWGCTTEGERAWLIGDDVDEEFVDAPRPASLGQREHLPAAAPSGALQRGDGDRGRSRR